MTKTLVTLILSTVALSAFAAPKEKFNCKQIADRAVRESCIASQDGKAAQSATPEKLKMDRFVTEAKARLTASFKDPQSAQFTNVLYIESGIMDSSYLCGSVNAKNSYGGYVGAKSFVVRKRENPVNEDPNSAWSIWTASEEASPLQVMQSKMAVAQCTSESAVLIN